MKVISGKVVATNLPKTARVEVERVVVHPLYKKRVRKIKTYHVDDELGVSVGDTVKFVACRPVSKLKKWKILEVVGAKKGK